MKRYLLMLSATLFFCLMLAFPQAAVAGAGKGLLLWFRVVLPTLLPFIILSNLLMQTHAVHYISKITGPLFCRFFRISEYGSFAVLTGFMCGYPMGSKVTGDLIRCGKISRSEGEYLLSFCNNTSPMFIISYVLMQNLKQEELLIPTLEILMGAPILCSFIFRITTPRFSFSRANRNNCPAPQVPSETFSSARPGGLVDQCIMNGFETITKVGGYIMLFSIILELGSLLPFSSAALDSLLFPSLEITNGIRNLCTGTLLQSEKFILCLSLTSFGGWCAVAQTQCMIQGTGLSIVPYIIQKLITAGVTSLLCLLYLTI